MNSKPICNLDAEGAVLSAFLLTSETVEGRSKMLETFELLDVSHFYSAANGEIYGAIRDLASGESPSIDIVTVSQALRSKGKLDAAGGSTYLAQIVDSTPAVWNVLEHAKIVRELATLRRSHHLAIRLAAEAAGPHEDPAKWLETAQAAVFETFAVDSESKCGALARDVMKGCFERARQAYSDPDAVGVPTGIARLDKFTLGFRSGALWTVAGRSGMGKTALVLNLAENVASRGHGVIFFSGEMGASELGNRMLSRGTDLPAKRIARGAMTEAEWSRLAQVAQERASLPLLIDDMTPIAPGDIRLAIRRHGATLKAMGKPVKLIVVDYLQLYRSSGKRGSSRTDELGELTSALKRAARELGVCVVALSQLNRDGKDGRPPVLTDLKDSSSIEQDSDVVAFIHRPGYFKESEANADGEAYIIIAKGRECGTGSVPVRWVAHRTEFVDIAERFTNGDGWDN